MCRCFYVTVLHFQMVENEIGRWLGEMRFHLEPSALALSVSRFAKKIAICEEIFQFLPTIYTYLLTVRTVHIILDEVCS
jgi:hypothetical protein